MALNKMHEIHTRRFGRNLGLGLVLGGFIVIVFGLTIVKVGRGDLTMQPQAQIQGASDGN